MGLAGDQKSKSCDTTLISHLGDLGISKDQSSKWQQLADIPEEQFESRLKSMASIHASSR